MRKCDRAIVRMILITNIIIFIKSLLSAASMLGDSEVLP